MILIIEKIRPVIFPGRIGIYLRVVKYLIQNLIEI